jgi:cytoskeletal protein RodZ
VIDQGHKLGEVLRAAREAKGTDLTRVERETKIRERYLSALERGEYRELPGAVYTKGFLRNYGAYLGLDPEYLIDLYRLETSTTGPERPIIQAPPRPIAARRRRTFVVTPGAVVAAILTLLVGAFVAWLGYEFVNFARTPDLRITEPAGDVAAHTGSTITVRGITAANARVTVRGLAENPTVTADAQGNFVVTVGLVPGSNVIRLVARDPVTNRDSEEVARTVVVADRAAESPMPSGAAVALTEPVADAVLGGPVTIAGTTAPAAQVVATASLVSAPTPSFTIADDSGAAVAIQPASPEAPAPVTLTADAAGAFAGSLSLPAGTWDVSVSTGGEPATRRVTVGPGAGLSGTLRIEGGPSYLEVDQDGVALSGVSGEIAQAGDTVNLTATGTIRIRAGSAGAVHVTIDGISIGPMGAPGAVVEWQITRSGA